MNRLVGYIMTLRPLARMRTGAFGVGALILCGLLALAATTLARRVETTDEAKLAEQSQRIGPLYYPTSKQWASLTTEPVSKAVFQAEQVTEGKSNTFFFLYSFGVCCERKVGEIDIPGRVVLVEVNPPACGMVEPGVAEREEGVDEQPRKG